jgi:hypothetical protein
MLISGKEKSNRTKTPKRGVNKPHLLVSSEALVYCDFFLFRAEVSAISLNFLV